LENFPKAIEYLLQALKIDEGNQNKKSAAIDDVTLGHAYEKMNKLDSASFYADRAFQQKDIFGPQYVYQVLGNIQVKKRNYEEAAHLFREGLMLSQKNDDLLTSSEICADISALFIHLNKRDSAIFYASKGFEDGQTVSFKKAIILSGNLLAELYDSTRPGAALKYFKIVAAAKDSLFGVNNIQTIQNLVSGEEAKQKELEDAQISYRNRIKLYGLVTGLAALLIIAFILYRNNRQKQKANNLLQLQKRKIETTLDELKSTQAQLIQSEKMASLGELTAGIAHEIQNPLNFVNNFSEVSVELIDDLKKEAAEGNNTEVIVIANEVADNLQKVVSHGKRAGSIVKGMLQHSRMSTGEKQFTDINALAEEYLRLSYQAMRSKDKAFQAIIETHFDDNLPKINVVPQDIGRVLLSLFQNAFYAVNKKKEQGNGTFEPCVSVTTRKTGSRVEIIVKDNGTGVPKKVEEKIFQPFFTTKPTGQGTGLGLSLNYNIIKAHGGEIKVETKEGEGAEFIIWLPISQTIK
jgi:two-component system, NtrC family, sensor kinase